jgi:hypothetical protein
MVVTLAVCGTVLGVAVAVLCVPISIEGSAQIGASFGWSVRVRWGFAALERSSNIPRERRRRRPRRKESPRIASGRAARAGRARMRLWTELATWSRVARLLRSLYARLRVSNFTMDCVFGLDDPADTGTLFGAVAPLLATVAARSPATCVVIPVFDGARLELRLAGAACAVPLRLMGPLAAFGWWLGLRYWRARGTPA